MAKDDLELRKILAHRTDSSQVALTRAEIHVCVADKADAAPFASNQLGGEQTSRQPAFFRLVGGDAGRADIFRQIGRHVDAQNELGPAVGQCDELIALRRLVI